MSTHPQGADAELESRIDEILGMFLLVLVEPMGFGSDTDMQTFVGNKERHDESWQTARESIKRLIAAQTDAAQRAKVDEVAEWLLTHKQDNKVDITYIDALISYKGARPSSKSQQTNGVEAL